MIKLSSPGLLICLLFVLFSCKGQQNNSTPAKASDKVIGGQCDGCDIMYIGMPNDIPAVDTSNSWNEPGKKLLVTGTVYKKDGITPAPGIIIYYYHTDDKGYYSPVAGMNAKAKRHGHIRGWVKTGRDGKYEIYTTRPASYPNSKITAHIHVMIKEPGINEYYIDEFIFDNDTFLNEDEKKRLPNRGGSGILHVEEKDSLQVATHPIILGLNIPDYPANN